MKKRQLIDDLSQDLKPVKCIKNLKTPLILWFFGSVIFILLSIWLIPVPIESIFIRLTPKFVLTQSVLLLLAIFAAWGAFKSTIPSNSCKYIYVIGAILLTWILMMLIGDVSMSSLYPDYMGLKLACRCSLFVLILSIGPTFLMLWLIIKGTSVYPRLSAALAALSCASMGSIGISIACKAYEPLHILVWHFIPVLIITTIAFFVGERLFKL